MQVASLYYPDAAVIVEDAKDLPSVRGSNGARVALVRADFNEHNGMSEVHLSYAGRVDIGRAGSGPSSAEPRQPWPRCGTSSMRSPST